VAALTRGAPAALAAAKSLLRRGAARPLREELVELTELSVRFFTADEAREGVQAYFEKRDPAWVHAAGSGPGVAPSS